MSNNEFSIRHRWLSTGGEWQVISGRKVVFRCDFEHQAKEWIEKRSPGQQFRKAEATPHSQKMTPTPNFEDEFWPYMQESRTSIVEKLVTASRTAQTVGRGVLSGGERVAVAFVLDRPDWLAEDRLTLAEALERITPDWLAAIPDAARRMKA